MNKYETLFLDWFNNFYSTKYMSSYYNINQSCKGRYGIRKERLLLYETGRSFYLEGYGCKKSFR